MRHRKLVTIYALHAIFLVFSLVGLITLPSEKNVPVIRLSGMPFYNESSDTLWVRTVVNDLSLILDAPFAEDKPYDTTLGAYDFPMGTSVACDDEAQGVHLPMYTSRLGVKHGSVLAEVNAPSDTHTVRLYQVAFWWLVVRIVMTALSIVFLVVPIPVAWEDKELIERQRLLVSADIYHSGDVFSVLGYVSVRWKVAPVMWLDQTISYAINVILLLAAMGVPWRSVLVNQAILCVVNTLGGLFIEIFCAQYTSVGPGTQPTEDRMMRFYLIRLLMAISFIGFALQAMSIMIATRGGAMAASIDQLLPDMWTQRDPHPLAWLMYTYTLLLPLTVGTLYVYTSYSIPSSVPVPSLVTYPLETRGLRVIADSFFTVLVFSGVYFALRDIYASSSSCEIA